MKNLKFPSGKLLFLNGKVFSIGDTPLKEKYVAFDSERTNEEAYPMVFNESTDYYVRSNGQINSSTSRAYFNVLKDCTINFYITQDSENNYDYGKIWKNGLEIVSFKGQSGSTTYDLQVVEGDVVTLSYQKDGSVSSGQDICNFKLEVNGEVIKPATAISFRMVTPPTKTTYKVNERMDINGAVFEATFDDGSKQTIDNSRISIEPRIFTEEGEAVVTFTYQGLSTTYKVIVSGILEIVLPEDSDFMWLASNYNNGAIPNSVEDSVNGFGSLEAYGGSITKEEGEFGSYLLNNSDYSYLYYTMNSAQLNAIKNDSASKPYTYIFKLYPTDTRTGGIMSCGSNGGYNYMIRNSGKKIQVHGGSGIDSTIILVEGHTYCVEMKYNNFSIYDLTTGDTYNSSFETSRSMGSGNGIKMTMMWAGYGTEYSTMHWYAMYGAPKILTDEEKQMVVAYIENNG